MKSKKQQTKSSKVFEIVPREKGDPLYNDPFASPNIILPVKNIEKSFLKSLGITEDMLPQKMRAKPKFEVIEGDADFDPEVFKVLYDDNQYEELTDDLIQMANEPSKSESFGDYGYVMNKFLNDLDICYEEEEPQRPKQTFVDCSNSLGTSCATSRRSKALRDFDERFQLFLEKESQDLCSLDYRETYGIGEIDLNELSADLDNLMNAIPKNVENSVSTNELVVREEVTWDDLAEKEDDGESDESTVVMDEESEVGSRRSSVRCMFSGTLMDGSHSDNLSMASISSRVSQPREIVHRNKPKMVAGGRQEDHSETAVEELPVLPQPDFSQIDRKAWKAMVKEDRRLKRARKKEMKILFTDNKLSRQRLMTRDQSKHVDIV